MCSTSSSTTVSTSWVISAFNTFEPVSRQGASDRDKRAPSSLACGATCSWRDLVVLVRKTTTVSSAKRALPSRGRGDLIQDTLPITAQHDDVAVSEFELYERVKNIHVAEEFVSHGFDDIRNANLCAVKLSVT